MIYRCKSSFAFGNPPHVYPAGHMIEDDDPILRTHRQHFEPIEAKVKRERAVPRSFTAVETATASPAEPRQVSAVPTRRFVGTTKGDK